MTDSLYTSLPGRTVIRVAGEEASAFLQGLITNDVADVAEDRGIYAALLTPQGKYLHDFFILGISGDYYLDCDKSRREDLLKRLIRYRLRTKIDIEDMGDAFDCFALFGSEAISKAGLSPTPGHSGPLGGGVVFVDPRRSELGARALLPRGDGVHLIEQRGFSASTEADYDELRLSLGIPSGCPEIEPEKSYPMDYGLDALNGVSFTKGCYVGQEVTARMKSRNLVRKCLVPVRIEGSAPDIGTILQIENSVAGELRGVTDKTGLALVKTEALEKALSKGLAFEAGDTRLIPAMPPTKN